MLADVEKGRQKTSLPFFFEGSVHGFLKFYSHLLLYLVWTAGRAECDIDCALIVIEKAETHMGMMMTKLGNRTMIHPV